MAIAPIQQHILSDPRYREEFTRLLDFSVARQFERLKYVGSITGTTEFDWPYLLFCASVLAQGDDEECQRHALRIATTCVASSSNTSAKDASLLVLDELSNRRAIALADQRGLTNGSIAARVGISARLEWGRRESEQSIVLANSDVIVANRFQRAFWDAAKSNKWLSVSAATSVGKSYIALRWLLEELTVSGAGVAIIIVPTRALIHQFEVDLRVLRSSIRDREINISSVPVSASIRPGEINLLVFTQERLQIFLNSFPDGVKLPIDHLFVDEAQKVGDGARGVLLQDAIERVVARNPEARLVFSSPLAANPEALLADAPANVSVKELPSSEVTVNQNLIWATQKPRHPEHWTISLCRNNEVRELGSLSLPHRPTIQRKRLAFVAHALASATGNVVYVDGAAEAEKVAMLLYELQGDGSTIDKDSEVQDLIELVRATIHSRYLLAKSLERGIAFHYGNMPLLVRTEIERLFNDGKIPFLVCTSTLIEGVNLPCRTLFVRAPHKGRGKPMDEADFWNLAGRAGRWGREFQGNVVCIDPHQWPNGAPKSRHRYKITRAVDTAFEQPDVLNYIEQRTPGELAAARPDLEAAAAYLMAMWLRRGSLARADWANRLDPTMLSRLDSAIGESLQGLELDPAVTLRHPGISPLAMERLWTYFEERADRAEDLVPVVPSSEDAMARYIAIFSRINKTLSPAFGIGRRTAMLGGLVTSWMRGVPLKRLIEDRLRYLRSKDRLNSLQAAIREVMTDVETVARFLAPRYLACYTDVLKAFLASIDRAALLPADLELSVLLEYGVPGGTALALMALGLSRTSALATADLIPAENLNEPEALQWLDRRDWEDQELPVLVKRELRNLLSQVVKRQ